MSSTQFSFAMSLQADNSTGNIVAVYFQIRVGKAAQVKELAGGDAFANYNTKGELLGIELLAPCQITVLDKIARAEPDKVRNFFRQSVPRQMALA